MLTYYRPSSIRINKSRLTEDSKGYGSLYAESDPEAGVSTLRLGLGASNKFHRDSTESYSPFQQSQHGHGGYRG
jgi:hypothetical protein